MRVLVVGGAGFVGRELCRQLAGAHVVAVMDTFRYGRDRFAGPDWRKPRLYEADVRDRAATSRVFAEFAPELVFHLAAVHYIPECEDDPATAVRTNVVGTINVMNSLPDGCRVVFASSGAVYAPGLHPHVESDPVGPSDVYGLTKLQAERYVDYFAAKKNASAVVVRLFNVVGPGETNPHLVPEMVAQVRAGHREVAIGNLWPRRSYLHVKDAAAGFAAAGTNGEVRRGAATIVNLGLPLAHSVSEIADKLAVVSGRQFALRQDVRRVRPMDRPVLAANHGRLTATFRWTPRYALEEALVDIWRDPDLAENLARRYRQ